MKQAMSSRARLAAASNVASAVCSPSARASAHDRTGARRLDAAERLHADHQLDRRRRGDRRQQRFGQPIGGHHRRDRPAVVEQIGVVLGGVGRVRRHRDAAGRHDREIGDRPLRPVLGDQQDAIAGRDALGAKGACQDPRLVRDPLPRPGLVGPATLGPKERCGGAPAGRPLEQLEQNSIRNQVRPCALRDAAADQSARDRLRPLDRARV